MYSLVPACMYTVASTCLHVYCRYYSMVSYYITHYIITITGTVDIQTHRTFRTTVGMDPALAIGNPFVLTSLLLNTYNHSHCVAQRAQPSFLRHDDMVRSLLPFAAPGLSQQLYRLCTTSISILSLARLDPKCQMGFLLYSLQLTVQ